MNCSDALTAMLAVDHSVLEGHGGSELSRHISGCPRCGKVAAQLLIDTRQLAAAVRAAPVPHPPRIVPWLVAAGAAAAFALAVWPRDLEQPPADVPVPAAAPVAAVPPPIAETVAADPVRPPQRPITIAAPTAPSRAMVPTPFSPVAAPDPEPVPPPEPVRPEPVTYAIQPGDAVSSPANDGTVRVDPPDGMQARVLTTRNPNITVVWLN